MGALPHAASPESAAHDSKNPRHLRAALRQRRDPPRPPRRIHPDRHLGALPEDAAARTRSAECWYVCADDTHGTPIMLRAEKDGITPEALIERVHGEHSRDFAGFHVAFDNFYTTHSPETQRVRQRPSTRACSRPGLIEKRSIEQYYDPVKQMFLPDRFIKGECPEVRRQGPVRRQLRELRRRLHAERPDRTVFGGLGRQARTAQLRPLFLQAFRSQLPEFPAPLDARTGPAAGGSRRTRCRNGWASKTTAKTSSPTGTSRATRRISASRSPTRRASISTSGSTRRSATWARSRICARAKGLDFDEYWQPDSKTELYHFIGKDILYFHALFWPAELEHAGYRTPSGLRVHGFLTVDGAKMSKSRGTFITAESYLSTGLNPEWLRYYYAAKLNSTMEDIDLNLDDFVARVNSDLIGKYVNIASRCAGFIGKKFAGQLAATDRAMAQAAARCRARRSPRLTRNANFRAHCAKSWRSPTPPTSSSTTRSPGNSPSRRAATPSCTQCVRRRSKLSRLLTLYLKPVLPKLAQAVEAFLDVAPLAWNDAQTTLPQGHSIKRLQPPDDRASMPSRSPRWSTPTR